MPNYFSEVLDSIFNLDRIEGVAFFKWLFGLLFNRNVSGNTYIPPAPISQNNDNIKKIPNGPSNTLGNLFSQSANQIEKQIGKENINQLQNNKSNMGFASNVSLSRTQNVQNSVNNLSNLLSNPVTNPAEANQYQSNLNNAISETKTQCQIYQDTHKDTEWTPTVMAGKSLVENTLQTVTKYENQPTQQNKDQIKNIANHPNCIKENNKVFTYKKGSHQVTDIKKFFKPVDYKLTNIKSIAPQLYEMANKEFKNSHSSLDVNMLPEHEKHAKKALKLIHDFSQQRYNHDLLEEKIERGLYKEGKMITKDSLYIDSKYDIDASQFYKEMTEYIKLKKDDLNNPYSLASQFKQLKDNIFPEGTLEVPMENEGTFIDATGKSGIENEKSFDGDKELLFSAELIDMFKEPKKKSRGLDGKKTTFMKDCSDEPLFPKEPHPSDVFQGSVGDCYFLAHLSKMAQEDPQSIKDMIKDNGNGTVTCRFYDDQRKPLYVTVNKTVPYNRFENEDFNIIAASNGEKVPLWVHMFEKAYMMSGLRSFNDRDMHYAESNYKKITRSMTLIKSLQQNCNKKYSKNVLVKFHLIKNSYIKLSSMDTLV